VEALGFEIAELLGDDFTELVAARKPPELHVDNREPVDV
jgi:hypothetical protein